MRKAVLKVLAVAVAAAPFALALVVFGGSTSLVVTAPGALLMLPLVLTLVFGAPVLLGVLIWRGADSSGRGKR